MSSTVPRRQPTPRPESDGDWQIYRGDGEPHDGIDRLPPPPPWRAFHGEPVVAPRLG
jgi:hypothetical protein